MADHELTAFGKADFGSWRLTSSDANAWMNPAAIAADATWFPARVPGTVAGALRDDGRLDLMNPPELDAQDWWYRCVLTGDGPVILHFAGLATQAEVWLDDACILRSVSMYQAQDIAVTLSGRHALFLCFRALAPLLAEAGVGKRARWRPKLMSPQSLRHVRTTLLGRMNGWCPPVHAVGPWRPISARPASALNLTIERSSSRLEGRDGVLDVRLRANRPLGAAWLRCAGAETPLCARDDETWEARLRIADVAPWWPHSHGEPCLHDVTLITEHETVALGRTGFRTIELDRDRDGRGFALRVNGIPVFCRGALWTSADLVDLPGERERYEPLLRLARDGGMNMLRVGATMVYETRAFHDLCDELGILVWQDFMFSNMDYPARDEAFCALVAQEATQLVQRMALSPSLAILCGGSEVQQQAAMMGLPAEVWSNAIFDETVPGITAAGRPDVIFVANTPFGGDLPFEPRTGLCHYYGVSAYQRPIEDARHANVRFAAECLGFANVPEGDVSLEPGRAAIVQPLWGEKFDRDVGAIWFFEDVRNHYLRTLYGVDPEQLRQDSPHRYLELSRAVNCELMEEVFALWRRHGSPTRGGLVWFLRDLSPGAGYGVIDVNGSPKSVWYGLRRAFRPVQILLVDEGLNGLYVHAVNERSTAFEGEIEIVCLRDGHLRVMQARQTLHLAAHDSVEISAISLWGAFFDTTYAYRFGEASHDVTVARLRDRHGAVSAEAFHFPLGRSVSQHEAGLSATLDETGGVARLAIATQRFARCVHIEAPGWRPGDNWFHLAPGDIKTIDLVPLSVQERAQPRGTITAMNAHDTVAFGDRA